MNRYTLERKTETVDTPYGRVRRKVSSGYGVKRVKYEYADLSRIAKERGMGLEDLRRELDGKSSTDNHNCCPSRGENLG